MKKYKVTQEFIDALKEWDDSHKYEDGTTFINQHTLNDLQEDVTEWLFETSTTLAERNRRYGAVINWINGEDVFDIETPKYIVLRNEPDCMAGKEYLRINIDESSEIVYYKEDATRFENVVEASGWANEHFEVVEVDE